MLKTRQRSHAQQLKIITKLNSQTGMPNSQASVGHKFNLQVAGIENHSNNVSKYVLDSAVLNKCQSMPNKIQKNLQKLK